MPFVRYWMHNNMVTVGGQKMGKSLGNFVTLKDAFVRWSPQAIRFFVLQSHYRSTLDFSDEAIAGAAKGLEKLVNTLRSLRERMKTSTAEGAPTDIDSAGYKGKFLAAMDDDFNTPQAIAVLFDMSKEVNRFTGAQTAWTAQSLQEIDALFSELMGDILGLKITDVPGATAPDGQLQNSLMELILSIRREARAQKLWSLSDEIRAGLAKIGISLEDRKEGTVWKKTL